MRTWRESATYTEQAAGLGLSVRRLDEVLYGAIFVACASPELYKQVPETEVRCIVTDPFGDEVPAIRIYFVVTDDNYLDALVIELVPDPDGA